MADEAPPGAAALRLTATVRRVVDGAGEEPLPVHRLVDALLSDERHKEYLVGWPHQQPVWPAVGVQQAVGRWLAELEPLLREDRVFGRLAVIGWCLLEPAVAVAAADAGVLGGMVADLSPSVEDHLSDLGLELLRQRAPLVALGAGQLPPALELRVPPGATERHLAVADAATAPGGSGRAVPWWAAATRDQVVVGRGDSDGRPVLADDEVREVTGIGWSRQGRLVITFADTPGRLVHDPRTRRTGSEQEWPGLRRAAVSPRAVVGAPGEGGLLWGPAEWGGGAVGTDAPRDPYEMVAAAPSGYAALRPQGPLVLLPPQDDPGTSAPPSVHPAPRGAKALDVVAGRAVVLTADGHLHRIGADDPDSADSTIRGLLPDGDGRFLSAGDDLVVMASLDTVAVVRSDALVARWRLPGEDGPATAVAVARDGSSLAVATERRLRVWRIDAVPDLRLTEYTADTPEGEDRLGIRPTVDALAAVVAARAVDPPLSIGLFGEWGSGKTFFMRRLEERVAAICRQSAASRRAQADLWAWRNIRQVRFNAWTYASADVWAGLVDELLRGLTAPPAPGSAEPVLPAELDALAERRLTALADAQRAAGEADEVLDQAVRAQRAAQDALAGAERDLDAARDAQRSARRGSALQLIGADVVAQVDEVLTVDGRPRVGADLERVWQDLAEARRSAESARGYLGGGRSAWLVAALAVGPALALVAALVGLDRYLDGLAPAVAGVAAGLGSIAAWLRSASGVVERRVAAVAGAERDARAAVRAAESEAEEKAAAVRAAEHEVAAARLTAAGRAEEVRTAERRAAAHDTGSLLVEFLEDRVRSQDYRAALGLIGTVRGDVEAVSTAVQQHNRAVVEERSAPDDVLNRVVLYVDDLDRCAPPVVVKVLEAVSMLLSFPLFVVVVAVDAEWVSRALATVYPTLLRDGRVTPEDYLEKIFQVPVWLDPPGPAAAGELARSLVGGTAYEDGAGGTTDLASRDGAAAEGPAGSGGEGRAAVTAATGARGPSGGGRSEGRPTRPDVSVATTAPQSLLLSDDERRDIARLAPSVARSPRVLKRWVNTYRLLKGLLAQEDLPVARLLLAAATDPSDGRQQLLQSVVDARDDRLLRDLVGETDTTWLDAVAGSTSWKNVRCADVRAVAEVVHRFVFRVGERPATARPGAPGATEDQ